MINSVMTSFNVNIEVISAGKFFLTKITFQCEKEMFSLNMLIHVCSFFGHITTTRTTPDF